MNAKNRQIMTVAAALAILSFSAGISRADFVGLVVEQNTDPDALSNGLHVVDFYAEFDDPTDKVLGTAFTDLTSSTGAFHQDGFGQNTAPQQSVVDSFPLVAFDSFVTIGVATDTGGDETQLSPDFDTTAFNNSGQVIGDWFNANPDNGQGLPDGSGRVLVARLTLDSPTGGETISGPISIGWQVDGSTDFTIDETIVNYVVPAPCIGDTDNDGDVDVDDLVAVIVNWGGGAGPADVDNDGDVDVDDLVLVIVNWGPCP